ncbi:MAG TPA: hypothetical protein VFD91_01815 [Mariniphaga sp.]|nr:hypothetical protein [Mariniphaga sp.]
MRPLLATATTYGLVRQNAGSVAFEIEFYSNILKDCEPEITGRSSIYPNTSEFLMDTHEKTG